jgi:hypothetical protein
LEGEELKVFKREYGNSVVADNLNKLYLWTEKGALLHAKSLNTDKAWEVCDQLVETYFQVKENQNAFNGISPELQAIIMHDKKIQLVENRIGKLENTMTIDYGRKRFLKKSSTKLQLIFSAAKTALHINNSVKKYSRQ